MYLNVVLWKFSLKDSMVLRAHMHTHTHECRHTEFQVYFKSKPATSLYVHTSKGYP